MATLKWTGGFNDDYSVAANWVNVSSGAASVPTASDTVIFADSSNPVRSGLNQSAVALTAVLIYQSYTGTIGTDSSYLQLRASTFDIGLGEGAGSSRIKISTGSAASATIRVHDTGASTDSLAALLLNVAHSSSALYVNNGDVGLATSYAAETSTLNLVSVGGMGSALAPTVLMGSGVTVATVDVYSGAAVLYGGGGSTTAHVHGGTLTLNTAAALTELSTFGGYVYADRHGTITTVALKGGTTDASLTTYARTWTTTTMYADATLKANASLTLTNMLALSGKLQLAVAEL